LNNVWRVRGALGPAGLLPLAHIADGPRPALERQEGMRCRIMATDTPEEALKALQEEVRSVPALALCMCHVAFRVAAIYQHTRPAGRDFVTAVREHAYLSMNISP